MQQTDPPGEMPPDVTGRGWKLKEHVDDEGRFQCVNADLKLTTNPFYLPQQCIEAARRIQSKYDSKHLPEQIAGDGASARGSVSRQFMRMLKVRLSPDGLQEKCAEYDAKCVERERMEADAKKIHDRYKEDIKVLDAEAKALEQIVRKQYVETEVACEERMDFASKTVRVVRLDTEEEVESREMTATELQQRLPAV